MSLLIGFSFFGFLIQNPQFVSVFGAFLDVLCVFCGVGSSKRENSASDWCWSLHPWQHRQGTHTYPHTREKWCDISCVGGVNNAISFLNLLLLPYKLLLLFFVSWRTQPLLGLWALSRLSSRWAPKNNWKFPQKRSPNQFLSSYSHTPNGTLHHPNRLNSLGPLMVKLRRLFQRGGWPLIHFTKLSYSLKWWKRSLRPSWERERQQRLFLGANRLDLRRLMPLWLGPLLTFVNIWLCFCSYCHPSIMGQYGIVALFSCHHQKEINGGAVVKLWFGAGQHQKNGLRAAHAFEKEKVKAKEVKEAKKKERKGLQEEKKKEKQEQEERKRQRGEEKKKKKRAEKEK